ncbi:MAG: DNA primase [Aestuariibacter sp.]
MKSGRIPRNFIDDLLARADIVEVIDAYVPLKKAGKNYQACCPFHNEKTPSFSVAPDKQFYHCFGCGAHGNAISFMMEYEQLEFPEAVEELARFYHLEVPREQGNFPAPSQQNKQQLQDDYQLMEQVARFFAHQFKHHQQGEKAIEYLKSRGLSGEVVKDFGIGYAPPEWDAVLSQFGRTEEAKTQLKALKLVNQNDSGREYDFFRDRIMFPIRDKRGRVIGFGGRVLEGDGPKYLNSPETRIFHKGYELYGLYQVKQKHRKLRRVMIVEGYMDVVALAQFEIDYAVAALGTATTGEHIQMLFRNTQEILCCYDGDRAGREAAWRALENALPYLKDGKQMKFLFLPDGEDPDTQVRKIGKDAFEQQFDRALPLSKFLFEHLLEEHDTSTLEGKAALKSTALPMLDKIPGEHQKQMLQEKLGGLTGDRTTSGSSTLSGSGTASEKTQKQDYRVPAKSGDTPIRRIIQLLLHRPAIAAEFPQISQQLLATLKVQGIEMLQQIHQVCMEQPQISSVQLLERFRDHPHLTALQTLLARELPQDKDLQKEYSGNIARLVELSLSARLEALTTKSQVHSLSTEEKQELILLTRKLNSGVKRD